ncbi:MAG: hypothetical protein WDW36_005205 [Sanguina aurantia]
MAANDELLIFTTVAEVRTWSRSQRAAGRTVAFVPTMGYLHEGHISLVKAALQHADVVVASIYVNPTQFSKNEDFDVYPRSVDKDREQLRIAGAKAVFEPTSLYTSVPGQQETSNVVGRECQHPDAHETFVQVERLQTPLCAKSRPHFFRGVATIVTKLFNIVEPDVAVFGQKDFQQWRVIERMVRDLDFPIKIVGLPICREADGMAMSSRNARLSPESRQSGLCISQALKWAAAAVQGPSPPTPAAIIQHVTQAITQAGGRVDYVELLSADNLLEIEDACKQPTLLAVAAHFPARDRGEVRLIDNMVLRVEVA